MENLLNNLSKHATEEQKKMVEELSDLCLDIINIAAPYDFEKDFCTAMNFIQNIHERNIFLEMMLQIRRKTREESEIDVSLIFFTNNLYKMKNLLKIK